MHLNVLVVLQTTRCIKSSPTLKLSGEFQQNYANFQDALIPEHFGTSPITPNGKVKNVQFRKLKSSKTQVGLRTSRQHFYEFMIRPVLRTWFFHASVEASLEMERTICLNANLDFP